ncbi:unnamed protein product, partial [Meganyctiphanes norvegica]
LDDLQIEFNDINCPNLSNKPKIFITNLCLFEGDITYESINKYESHIGNLEDTNSDSEDWVLDGNTENSDEYIQEFPAERDMFFLNVEMEGSRCESGSLLTEALFQVLMQSNSPKQLIKIMRSVSERLDELQEGSEEDYLCEIQTIKFPPDFHISPVITKEYHMLSQKMNTIERLPPYPWKAVKVKESKKEQKYEESCYRNKSLPRGLALIISFSVYDKDTLPNCPWRNDDALLFKKLFNKLGYKVKLCSDTSLQDTQSHLDEFSRLNEHLKGDSCLILIMGHGVDRNTFYTKEGNKLRLQDIYSKFTDYNCRALKGKPKIFLQHMTRLDDFNSHHIGDSNERELDNFKSHHIGDSNERELDDFKSHHIEESIERELDLRDAFSIQLSSTVTGNTVSTMGLWELRILLEEHAHNTHIEGLLSRLEMKIDTSKEHCDREYFVFDKNFFINPKECLE